MTGRYAFARTTRSETWRPLVECRIRRKEGKCVIANSAGSPMATGPLRPTGTWRGIQHMLNDEPYVPLCAVRARACPMPQSPADTPQNTFPFLSADPNTPNVQSAQKNRPFQSTLPSPSLSPCFSTFFIHIFYPHVNSPFFKVFWLLHRLIHIIHKIT